MLVSSSQNATSSTFYIAICLPFLTITFSCIRVFTTAEVSSQKLHTEIKLYCYEISIFFRKCNACLETYSHHKFNVTLALSVQCQPRWTNRLPMSISIAFSAFFTMISSLSNFCFCSKSISESKMGRSSH